MYDRSREFRYCLFSEGGTHSSRVTQSDKGHLLTCLETQVLFNGNVAKIT